MAGWSAAGWASECHLRARIAMFKREREFYLTWADAIDLRIAGTSKPIHYDFDVRLYQDL